MLCHYNSILSIKMEIQQICDNQGEMTENSQLNLLIQQFGQGSHTGVSNAGPEMIVVK